MSRKKNARVAGLVLAGFCGIWFFMAAVFIPGLCAPVVFPDETGYWAQAAAMAGMDWREVVSQYSWYSFGYGLLMLPFIKTGADPSTLYRCMAGVNFLLLAGAVLLLYRMLKEIFPGAGDGVLACAGGGGMLYVSWTVYAGTTLTEALLTFLYVLAAWGTARQLRHPGGLGWLLPAVAAGCMYMVHMRTVGIVLGIILCMAAGAFLQKKEAGAGGRLWCFLFVLILFFLAAAGIKAALVAEMGSEIYTGKTGTNSYSGQWGKIAFLFTPEGIWNFAAGLAGKIFYLGCASFGMYFWGMTFLLREVHKLAAGIRTGRTGQGRNGGGAEGRGICTVQGLLCLWVLLTHLGALLICCIYCLRTDRLDGLLYGRYHENTLPPILALGILELAGKSGVKRRFLQLLGILGGCFFTVFLVLGTGEIRFTERQSVTGILYALDLAQKYDRRTILYAYMGGILGGILVLGAADFARRGKGKRRKCLLLVPCLLQLLLGIYGAETYVQAANRGQREDAGLLSMAREEALRGGQQEAVYLCGGASRQMCLAQFMLWDVSLHPYLDGALPEGVGEIFLVEKGNGMEETLPEDCEAEGESPRYILYRRRGP